MVNTVILSFPRSGNHWIRFLCEYISGVPTLGCLTNNGDTSIYQQYGEKGCEFLNHVNPQAAPQLLKDHWPRESKRLITLVRSPFECILRHRCPQHPEHTIKNLVDWYVDILIHHENFEGDKFMIFYEDMFCAEKKRRILFDLNDFMGWNQRDRIECYLKNQSEIDEISKNPVHRLWAGSVSNENLNYHATRSKENCNTVAEIRKTLQQHPMYSKFEKYLKKYE